MENDANGRSGLLIMDLYRSAQAAKNGDDGYRDIGTQVYNVLLMTAAAVFRVSSGQESREP
jgi:hypothetical protein